MEQFIETPYLPRGRVTLVAVSGRYPELIYQLEKHGIRCILLPACSDLPAPVCDHPDMLLHHFGGNRILLYPYHDELICRLKEEGFELSYPSSVLKERYPYDIRLNCFHLGKYLVGNLPWIEERILSYYQKDSQIFTRQGYTKCSCAIVDSNSVITTDRGLEHQLREYGMDVLYLTGDCIRLEGYSHGLIGGCCGMVSPEILCFTGSLDCLPKHEKENVCSFLEKKGVRPVFLTEKNPIDIGSVIPLKEDLSISPNLW